jgi:hypothetical protein
MIEFKVKENGRLFDIWDDANYTAFGEHLRETKYDFMRQIKETLMGRYRRIYKK